MSDEGAYWLISAPGIPSKDAAYKELVSKTSGLANAWQFNVPADLKVGTLDSLVALSDDLGKLDPFVEGVVRKIATMLQDLLADHEDKLIESLTAEGQSCDDYVRRFQWDVRKYSVKTGTRDLVDSIVKKTTDTETELKTRTQAYTQVKNTLNAVERGQTGSLLSRNLGSVVERKHVVQGSEHLQTMFVAVPVSSSKDFQEKYEKLTDMVVPRSGQKVAEDSEYELWSVTLFKRVADDFKNAAREFKFIVRDFVYDPELTAKSESEKKEMEADLKKQWSRLVQWGKTYFSETFTSWIHLKAIRLFVESVLRYGLPANFQGALLEPAKKKEKNLRQALEQMYASLENRGQQRETDGKKKKAVDEEGPAGLAPGEYYPYVYDSFALDFAKHKKK